MLFLIFLKKTVRKSEATIPDWSMTMKTGNVRKYSEVLVFVDATIRSKDTWYGYVVARMMLCLRC